MEHLQCTSASFCGYGEEQILTLSAIHRQAAYPTLLLQSPLDDSIDVLSGKLSSGKLHWIEGVEMIRTAIFVAGQREYASGRA